MERLKDGAVILFGDAAAPAGSHFRQDNDFYYFTGNEDLGAILVLVPASRGAYLFLPPQTAREKTMDGPNLLEDPEGKAKGGFTDIFPSSYLDEFLARSLGRFSGRFHLRLSPRDSLDDARSETGLMDGRRARSHYNDQLSPDLYRIEKLRQRYPQMELRDITPVIDEMRAIKTAAEIAALRRNGKLSAEAVRQAMLADASRRLRIRDRGRGHGRHPERRGQRRRLRPDRRLRAPTPASCTTTRTPGASSPATSS